MNDAEYLAMMFHHYYEELAHPGAESTRKPWAEVPSPKKLLMIAVAESLLDGHVQIIKKESTQ